MYCKKQEVNTIESFTFSKLFKRNKNSGQLKLNPI